MVILAEPLVQQPEPKNEADCSHDDDDFVHNACDYDDDDYNDDGDPSHLCSNPNRRTKRTAVMMMTMLISMITMTCIVILITRVITMVIFFFYNGDDT